MLLVCTKVRKKDLCQIGKGLAKHKYANKADGKSHEMTTLF